MNNLLPTFKTLRLWILLSLLKALIVVSLLLILFTAAQGAYTNTLYMPIVFKQPTHTPTNTATPSPTFTPTPTNTKVPGIYIIHIEYNPSNELEEYVTIKNTEGQTQDMTGWILKNDHDPADIFNFPNNYKLLSGKSVKVWTKSGTDTSTDLYWGSDEPVWNLGSDCGYLRNEDNVRISSYCYSKPTKTPTSTLTPTP